MGDKGSRILLVEDDRAITDSLKEFLSSEGLEVFSAGSQKEALEALEGAEFDMILLDLTLPDGSGYSICHKVKEESDIPVIFLTASDDENSVVTGFDLGADDYIAKPFRPRELLSRIRNVLRRSRSGSDIIKIHDLKIDQAGGRVFRDGEEIPLSAMEYRLFGIFLENRGRILSRNQLLEAAWDFAGDFVNDNTLSVYIKRLREKIEVDPQKPEIIRTVRGLGYRMDLE